MSRALLLQLARLGDLIQSLPVITALHSSFPEQPLDLLCAAPLVQLGRLFPGIHSIYPWEGEKWNAWAMMPIQDIQQQMEATERYLADFSFPNYSVAYNLNNHPRSILASHLFSERVVGAGELGPLHTSLPPWVDYLRQVAYERGNNRIHLADAFCGICGVPPPTGVPTIEAKHIALPNDMERVVKDLSGVQIGLVLGAGDPDRRVPLSVWQEFIQSCTERVPRCRLLLIGGSGEREAALVLEHNLSAQNRNQVINCCGRTNLPQLAAIFHHCQWVVGSDTGPLHLGVLCGAQAIGLYFSRARVHETGPYGAGHWVWQAEGHQRTTAIGQENHSGIYPKQWPVKESVDLLLEGNCRSIPEGWSVWKSHRDHLGAFYSEMGHLPIPSVEREQVWQQLAGENTMGWNSINEVPVASDFQNNIQV